MPATNRLADVSTSSNQKGAISKTVCGWHVRILLRITVARILLDFDFLRGLAPGRLDGFSIGRYEKNRGSFDLNAANPFKTKFPPLSLYYKEQSTAN